MDKNTDAITDSKKVARATAMGLLVAFGIVFGDIGTSPLYVMKAIVRATPGFDEAYIIGAVSCIIWTLTIQTTIKYVIIALRADNKGEGGILALYSLVKNKGSRWLYIVAAIGAATLIADGVITPAVTVTSAIEGLKTFGNDIPVTGIVLAIISAIFIIQGLGTAKIGKWFGPIMLVWFLSLGVFGTINMAEYPSILRAFNPWWAVRLLTEYPGWFVILGAIFLCTTGAEALYSDLGHCGRINISMAWGVVKVMLVLNYLGQGAWIINHPGIGVDTNPFYSIIPHGWLIFEIVLATLAAIIASQALISGSFTIFSEAIALRFWPWMKIKYPSLNKGQLFIPAINIFLYVGCILTVLVFRTSDRMEAAYGLAITITMLMTTVLLAIYLRHKGVPKWGVGLFIIFFGIIEGAFLFSNLFKFMHGGWYTLLIAGVLAIIILTWRNGSIIKDTFKEYRRIDDCLGIISDISNDREIPRYASNLVYINRSDATDLIESKIIYSIVNKSPKRADHYWFIRMEFDDAPDTLDYNVKMYGDELIYCVDIRIGYAVQPKLTVFLRQIVEDLVAENKLNLTSRYPSLKSHGVAGEFRFIVISRLFSASQNACGGKEAFVMNLHDMVGRFSRSDATAFGLDVCNLTVENTPLIISPATSVRIKKAT